MSTHDPGLFPDLVERTPLDGLVSCYDSLGACLAALEILEAGAAAGDATAIRHSLAHLERQVKEAAAHLAPALRALLVAAQEPPAERREKPAAASKGPEPDLPGFPSNVRAHFAAARGDDKVLNEELRAAFCFRDPLLGPVS